MLKSNDWKLLPTVLVCLLVFVIQCDFANNSEKFLKFPLIKKTIDEKSSFLSAPVSGLSLSSQSIEKVSGIPEGISQIEFFSLNVSKAPDSIVTGISAKNNTGTEVYFFDTNNDNNFSDELPLSMPETGELIVSLNFDELVQGKPMNREIIIGLRKDRRLEYQVNNYWYGEIFGAKDTLKVAVARIFPAYAFLYLDTKKNDRFDKYFDTRSEILAFNDKFYKIQIDLPAEEMLLLETRQTPVDAGFPAPDFFGKICQSEHIFKLSEQRGKVTVLFFGHPDCGGTVVSMPSLVILHQEFASNPNINFISIAPDSGQVLQYHKKYDFPFESIIDSKIWKNYGVIAVPNTFIIDQQGIIRLRENGGSPELGKKLEKALTKLIQN